METGIVNLITRMISLEIVWRQCGKCYSKLVWRLFEFSWEIKLPHNLHITVTIKSP